MQRTVIRTFTGEVGHQRADTAECAKAIVDGSFTDVLREKERHGVISILVTQGRCVA